MQLGIKSRRQLETNSRAKSRRSGAKLTDDDLTTIAGKRDQLAGLIQQHYGIAKEQAEKDADDFAKSLSK